MLTPPLPYSRTDQGRHPPRCLQEAVEGMLSVPLALTQGLDSRAEAQCSPERRTRGRHPASIPGQAEGGTSLQGVSESQPGVPVSAGPRPQRGSGRPLRSCWNTDSQSCHLTEGGQAAMGHSLCSCCPLTSGHVQKHITLLQPRQLSSIQQRVD